MTTSSDPLFEFGPFRLDPRRRRLWRDGSEVQLSPKTVDVLAMLVRNGGTLVDKRDMLDELWPETFVEEANLSVHVSTLRKALGDRPDGGRYIETVPRRGYRFSADVREVADIGDAEFCSVVLEEREHTEVLVEELGASRTLTRPAPLIAVAVVIGVVAIAGAVFVIGRQTGPVARGSGRSASAAGIESPDQRAREAVLRGRHFWNQRTAEGIEKSIACFREAIALDPASARAHAGLADAYAFDNRRWQEAEQFARRAIELDPSLGEPHASIGFVRMYWLHDWQTAGDEFVRSTDAAPDYATGRQWYGLYLAARGDLAGAEQQLRRARDLEPLSLAINLDLARVLYFSRRFDDAVEQCRRTIELDPDFAPAHVYLHDALTEKGLYPEAFDALVRAWRAFGRSPEEIEALEVAFRFGGLPSVWRVRLERELHTLSPVELAECAVRLGDPDAAAAWLFRACEREDLFVVFVGVHPAFDGLRGHAGLLDVKRRLNLAG